MTMPHLMNCSHDENGWCIGCVKEMHAELEKYREALQKIEQVGHNPADLKPEWIGMPDRWERLSLHLASIAQSALH